MVNKRGIIRIIEACIAIMIVFTTLIILNIHNNSTPPSQDFTQEIDAILTQVAQNITFRNEIINYDLNKSEDTLQNKNILNNLSVYVNDEVENPYLNFSVKICSPDSVCAIDNYPKNIDGGLYAGSRLVSTTITAKTFDPRQIKIFLWKINT